MQIHILSQITLPRFYVICRLQFEQFCVFPGYTYPSLDNTAPEDGQTDRHTDREFLSIRDLLDYLLIFFLLIVTKVVAMATFISGFLPTYQCLKELKCFFLGCGPLLQIIRMFSKLQKLQLKRKWESNLMLSLTLLLQT